MYNTLEQVFGFTQFRAGQEAVVSAVLAGRSAAAIFPTGSGKSLCYQLSALMLPHLTLVVSPLLALMQDQLAFLQRHGIAAASIDSAQSREDASAVMAKAKSGELKILMISVERLKNERFRNFLQQVPISLLVVDEAHCISEWGHNFRPDYLKLPDYQRQFNIPQALLLTATATPNVIADMQTKFAIAEADVITTGFYRANLNLWVEPVTGAAKRARLVQWMGERIGQPSIVYVTLQKTAEQIAEHLSQHGISANAYHAGMPHNQRENIQRQFMEGRLNCIVATIAFGMGIDKPDVRFVAHLDLPRSIEGYYQETGRAGRDGLPATAWMAYGLADVVQQRQLIESGDADDQARRNQLAHLGHMLELSETVECRRRYLLRYFGQDLAEPCGNCDVCLDPPKLWDATVPAQKLLSTVLRTYNERRGRTFAAGQHIDVLRGVVSERVTQLRLDELSTWGIGVDLSVAQWRGVVRHLLATGVLESQGEWGVLAPTDAAKPVLRGEQQVLMREEVVTRAAGRSSASKRNAISDLTDEQQETFERLRLWRLEEAREQGVPPYVVFGDATLRALSTHLPQSDEALLEISGIGQSKLERYGEAVLALLAE